MNVSFRCFTTIFIMALCGRRTYISKDTYHFKNKETLIVQPNREWKSVDLGILETIFPISTFYDSWKYGDAPSYVSILLLFVFCASLVYCYYFKDACISVIYNWMLSIYDSIYCYNWLNSLKVFFSFTVKISCFRRERFCQNFCH